MSDSHFIFLWRHWIECRMIWCLIKLSIRFFQSEPRQSLHHENFLTDVSIVLEFLQIDKNLVVLPQLFLKFLIIVIVLNIRLLLLFYLSLQFIKFLFQLFWLEIIRNRKEPWNLATRIVIINHKTKWRIIWLHLLTNIINVVIVS